MSKLLAIFLMSISIIVSSNADILEDSVLTPEIRSIKLNSFSAEENHAVFDVEVYNPNAFKLPVRELYGDIHLNQYNIADIEASSKQSLGAHATQMFTVPVEVNPDALMNAAAAVMIQGLAKYSFKGYVMTPVGEMPITQAGELNTEQVIELLHATTLPAQ
jgi:LEA14-like dessication related protein